MDIVEENEEACQKEYCGQEEEDGNQPDNSIHLPFLQVAQRGLVAFRDNLSFIDKGPDYYKSWGQ